MEQFGMGQLQTDFRKQILFTSCWTHFLNWFHSMKKAWDLTGPLAWSCLYLSRTGWGFFVINLEYPGVFFLIFHFPYPYPVSPSELCWLYYQNISPLHWLSVSITTTLVQATMILCLDYCSSILAALPSSLSPSTSLHDSLSIIFIKHIHDHIILLCKTLQQPLFH